MRTHRSFGRGSHRLLPFALWGVAVPFACADVAPFNYSENGISEFQVSIRIRATRWSQADFVGTGHPR
jgi:hypothetical protein